MKNYHLLASQYRLNSKLQVESTDLYWSILDKLSKDFQHFDMLQELRASIKARDFLSCLSAADSLSEQKYPDATQHFVANQFANLVRKYPDIEAAKKLRPDVKATKTFLSAERRCRLMNEKFRLWRNRKKARPYEREFDEMRKFIAYVIGFEPKHSVINSLTGFGPGASIGVHGDATNAARKLLSSDWSVSASAYYYAYVACMEHVHVRAVLLPEHAGFTSGDPTYALERERFRRKSKLCNNNKITFVPKTAKTHRSIAIEPLLNGFVQKGVDELLRLNLKRIGIDLSDQEPNRRMAREGSFDDENSFVTIDLSAASDSISKGLCEELLPPEWYHYLDSIRSKYYELNGEVYPYHKFCSMGNGFCFPLETLIFTAACKVSGAGDPGRDFRVYGDDIIVRKSVALETIKLLNYMGFKVNTDKTFLTGPFRESCGADWFNGKDVRPYTLDHRLDSLPALFKFLNLTRRNDFCSHFFSGVRDIILSRIPRQLQFYRPWKGLPDSGIDSVSDEYLTSANCRYLNRSRLWAWRELLVSPIQDNILSRAGDEGPSALMYGALSGSASASPFSLRRKTRTKVRIVSHPGATSTWLPPTSSLSRTWMPYYHTVM